MSPHVAERLIQVGMRAVIRDIQDYLTEGALEADKLRAYLLAMLITAGAYDDGDDPFGALRHELRHPDE